LAIAGIIAMVAIPSYNKQLQKNQRAVAKARMVQAAQLLERFYSDNNTYYVDTSGSPCVLSVSTSAQATANGFMKLMNQTWACSGPNTVYSGSSNESTSLYTVSVASNTATGGPSAYVLSATPQAGTSQASDFCGVLTLTNAGVKGFTPPTGSTAQLSDCW
jgi:type IV pilus assembly protein PilE